MEWNAFKHASADDVQKQESLPDACENTVRIGGVEARCRKKHFQGELLHEDYIRDDTGDKTIRVEWR